MHKNWKHIASTAGYKSLKAAYIHDINTSGHSKKSLYKKFQRVINRAKHYSHHTGKSIADILEEWENERTYWWINFYGDNTQPKISTYVKKPIGIEGLRKSYKKRIYISKQERKHAICEEISKANLKKSTKIKKRWSMKRKKRYR